MLKQLQTVSRCRTLNVLTRCIIRSKSTISAIRYGIRKSERESQSTFGQRSYLGKNEERPKSRNDPRVSRFDRTDKRGSERFSLRKNGERSRNRDDPAVSKLARNHERGPGRSYLRKYEEQPRSQNDPRFSKFDKNDDRGKDIHFEVLREPNPRRANDLEISYTTAASEFLYGTSSVLSALKAGRRKFYKLYLAERSEDGSQSTSAFEKWARLRGIKAVMIKPHQISSLDKASKGRPHNVCN